MISINATLLVQMVQFLILAYILNRLMFKPILKILSERTNYLSDTKLKINNIEEETKDLIKKCSFKETEARKEAADQSSQLKREGSSTAETIFNDAKEEVTAIKDKVSKEMEKKIDAARESLQKEAASLADVIIEKIIGRRINS